MGLRLCPALVGQLTHWALLLGYGKLARYWLVHRDRISPTSSVPILMESVRVANLIAEMKRLRLEGCTVVLNTAYSLLIALIQELIDKSCGRRWTGLMASISYTRLSRNRRWRPLDGSGTNESFCCCGIEAIEYGFIGKDN